MALSNEAKNIQRKVVARFEELHIEGKDVMSPELRAATSNDELLHAMHLVRERIGSTPGNVVALMPYILQLRRIIAQG